MIYRLRMSNVILINLFVIANERRFKENMINNVGSNAGFQWFVNNPELTEAALESISQSFKINKWNKAE